MMGDYAIALKNFREAAAQGHAKAQFELGLMYEQGDGVPKDPNESAKWYRKALAQGHELARKALARVEERPGGSYKDGVAAYERGDFKKAFRLWQPLAASGNIRAQARLGLLFDLGRGVASDLIKAVNWYRKAAEQGFAPAQMGLALMFIEGRGVRSDKIEAYKWLSFAVAQKNSTAITLRRNLEAGMDTVDIGNAKRLVRKLELQGTYYLVEPDAGRDKAQSQTQQQAALNQPVMLKTEVQKGGLLRQPISPSAGYTKELEALHNRPMSENAQIVPDLEAKIRTLPPPYLYELARRTFDTDRRKSFVWFLTGYLRAAYDASKCTDKSAGQGVLQLPALAPRVAKALFADKKAINKIMAEALERENSFPENSDPRWICFHGMKAMMAAMEKRPFSNWAKPQSEWAALRAELMAEIKATLN